MTRLKEWKKVFLAQGAAAVVIYEGGYGDTASWEVHVHHKSAADFGKYKDKFTNNFQRACTSREVAEGWSSPAKERWINSRDEPLDRSRERS